MGGGWQRRVVLGSVTWYHTVQVYSIIARYRALSSSASVVIPSVLSLHTITIEVVSRSPVLLSRVALCICPVSNRIEFVAGNCTGDYSNSPYNPYQELLSGGLTSDWTFQKEDKRDNAKVQFSAVHGQEEFVEYREEPTALSTLSPFPKG